MTLDEIIKQLAGKPKLDQKESSYGLWDVTEENLFSFLQDKISLGFPYPIFCSPVGGNIYLYFETNEYKLPLSVRVVDHVAFSTKLNSLYNSRVNHHATV